MANLSEKINFLRQEFVEMDMNHDQTLSREELYTFLDQKAIFSIFFYFFLKKKKTLEWTNF